MPRRGSLRESVLILYNMKQEEITHARMRAMAQILVDKEKGVSAFEEYMKAAFPWIETVKGRDRQAQIHQLMDEIKKGALSIKPMGTGQITSRIKSRHVKEIPATAAQRKAGEELFRKMGKVIPHGSR